MTATTSDGSATTADSDYVANAQLVELPDRVHVAVLPGDGERRHEERAGRDVHGHSQRRERRDDDRQPDGDRHDHERRPGPVDHHRRRLGARGERGTDAVRLHGHPLESELPDRHGRTMATADGTATTAGTDYASAAGTLTFSPGVTTQPVTVNVNGDGTDEPDETFFVNLSSPSNATIGDPQAQGTIQNDDSPTPTFSIANVSQAEGNAGDDDLHLHGEPLAGVGVRHGRDGDDVGRLGDDGRRRGYVASTQVLAFPIGSTSQTFQVTVNGETKYEPTEAFTVTLSGPTGGAAIGPGGTATGTITNDDVDAVDLRRRRRVARRRTRGRPRSTSRSRSPTRATRPSPSTGSRRTGRRRRRLDYAAAGGTLTFAPGVTTQPATVNVDGDTTDEPDETFFVNSLEPRERHARGRPRGRGRSRTTTRPRRPSRSGTSRRPKGTPGRRSSPSP